MLAQEEARRLGHNFVGTEQILLGLIGESTGIAAKVLKSMGVNLKDARVEVEKIIGAFLGPLSHLVPSSQALCKGALLSSESWKPASVDCHARHVLIAFVRVMRREGERLCRCGDPLHAPREARAGAVPGGGQAIR